MNGKQIKVWVGVIIFCITGNQIANAQVVPDSTLPNNSRVTSNANTFVIEGGTEKGSNLFHSFGEFSIPTGRAAYFNNDMKVENIFSRVTGSSISSIDGLIRANGAANLFLLNPNGILFGSNAVLNIGGSFLGSSASLIKFADGTHFSAKAPQSTDLLTVSVPLGLQFDPHSGAIQVQGNGHTLTSTDPIFSPLRRSGQRIGLTVRPGKTLALVGGDLSLGGGNINAIGGRIELGSVGSGNIKLIPNNIGFTLDYGEIQEFQDIHLFSKASVDASGLGSGSVQLQARNIRISDGSVILIQNQGLVPGGDITIKASSELALSGTTSDGLVRSSVLNEVFGNEGGNIAIKAKDLNLDGGGAISTRAYQTGQGGQITVDATNSIHVSGFNETVPEASSTIATVTFGSRKGGDVTATTDKLIAENGGTIGTTTLGGTGNGGALNVKASTIVLKGISPASIQSSLFSNSGSSGDSGQIVIEASELNILEGGQVDSSTGASGDAGDIFINTSKLNLISSDDLKFELQESGQLKRNLDIPISSIVAASAKLPSATAQLFRLSDPVTGSSGNININAKVLTSERGQISVRNQSTGNSGNIEINANSLINREGIIGASGLGQTEGGNIQLKVNNSLEIDGGIITTSTRSLSGGGNIKITTGNLQAHNRSRISAGAGNQGKGGNIQLDTRITILSENSKITTNAFKDQGGNIQISAQGIFRSSDSDITASSKLGTDGTVQINTPNIDPNNGLVNLPAAITDLSNSIGRECANTVGPGASKFIVTGRGGLPEDPTKPLNGQTIWTDSRLFLTTEKPTSPPAPTTQSTHSTAIPLIEASLVEINSEGEAVLISAAPSSSLQVPWLTPSCHAS